MSDHSTGNGHEPTLVLARPRGRAVPDYPSTVLPSGHEVRVRRLASGTSALLRAQAYKELEAERPQPPTQVVDVGPGQQREVAREKDPDHLAAVERWGARVTQRAGEKLIALLATYAILNETDQEAVDAYKAAMTSVGITVEEDDRSIYCWQVLAPTNDDQSRLIAFVLGLSEPDPEAVRAHMQTFRGDAPGPAA